MTSSSVKHAYLKKFNTQWTILKCEKSQVGAHRTETVLPTLFSYDYFFSFRLIFSLSNKQSSVGPPKYAPVYKTILLTIFSNLRGICNPRQ